MLSSRSRVVVVSSLVACAVGLVACKDEPNNGVNDVKKACELRVSYARLETERCRNCMAAAPAPTCECEAFKEWASLCKEQGDARGAEPSCTLQLDQCVVDCRNDCACIDRCYAPAPACREKSAARDGCVVDVCADECR